MPTTVVSSNHQNIGQQMKDKKTHSMTVEEIDAATTSLTNQRGAMRFLLAVSPQVRRQIKRLPSKATQVAEDRLKAALQHVELLPANFELRRFERDVALMKALER